MARWKSLQRSHQCMAMCLRGSLKALISRPRNYHARNAFTTGNSSGLSQHCTTASTCALMRCCAFFFHCGMSMEAILFTTAQKLLRHPALPLHCPPSTITGEAWLRVETASQWACQHVPTDDSQAATAATFRQAVRDSEASNPWQECRYTYIDNADGAKQDLSETRGGIRGTMHV